ncbi:hypothetical protein MMC12_004301 [Toensbergia leucococca]|nr:hypothetical protein [Toensbergia leucococca]
MCADGHSNSVGAIDMLIEIGPHSSLKTPIHEILKDNKIWGPSIKYIPSLSRGQDANIDVLRLASALFATGYDVDIPAINSIHAAQEGEGHLLCDVPSYSWTHLNTLWYESRLSKNHRCRKFPRIDLLGVLVDDFKDMDLRWRGVLRVSGLPWLSQHKIQGNTVFPMAAFLAMIIEAAHQRAILRSVTMTNSSKYVLKEISVKRPLLLPDSAEIETSLTLKAHREGSRNSSTSWDEFFIYSWTAEAGWSEHCQGLIMVVETPKIANPIDGQRFAQGREAAIRDSIEQQEKLFFQNVVGARACAGHCIATLEAPDTAAIMPNNSESDFAIHPAFLDSCVHPVFLAWEGGIITSATLRVPNFINTLSISHRIPKTPRDRFQNYISTIVKGKDTGSSIVVFDNSRDRKTPVIEINSMIASVLPGQNVNDDASSRDLCERTQWEACLDLLSLSQYQEILPSVSEASLEPTQFQIIERATFSYLQEALNRVPESEVQRLLPHHQRQYLIEFLRSYWRAD